MPAPIDLEHLQRYTMGEADLEREILGLFVEQAPKTLAEMQTAANERAWAMAAHSLKGSARAVGANAVAELAEAAEAAGFPDTLHRETIVARLGDAVDAVRKYVCGKGD